MSRDDAAPPLPSTPLARDDPPWTDCGDAGAATFGQLFAWPAAHGASALTFDPAGRRHAATLFASAGLDREIVIHGRRFAIAAAGGSPA